MLDIYIEFENLIKKFNEAELEYALCGGLAMAVYSYPRATVDIEFFVPENSIGALEKILTSSGFTIKSAPMKFQDGETIIHRFTKIDKSDDEFLSVDLILVTEKNKKAWEDIKSINWKDETLKVVSRDGLILLKMLRNSDQDRVDIQKLKE